MTLRIDNDKALQKIVAKGLIPSIQESIQAYESGENQCFYDMALDIGEYIDTYHKVFRTGNKVECVQPVEDKRISGKENE